jgi:hypothetical protein
MFLQDKEPISKSKTRSYSERAVQLKFQINEETTGWFENWARHFPQPESFSQGRLLSVP